MWQKCVIIMANVRYAISSRCIFPLLLRIESEKRNRSYFVGTVLFLPCAENFLHKAKISGEDCTVIAYVGKVRT